MGNVTPLTPKLTVQGRATDDEVKTEAFRLWIEYSRSAKRVAEALGCSESTVHLWRVSEKWEERRQMEAQAFMPGVKVEGAVALRLASYNAARRLQQITFDLVEHGIPVDDKEVKSLVAICSIGGYAPNANSNPVDVNVSITTDVTAKDLTDDDLSDRESTLGAGRHAHMG